MALPAMKFEPEVHLEDRVARLEVNVEHIQKDVSEMKVDIRRLRDKMDGMNQTLSDKIDGVEHIGNQHGKGIRRIARSSKPGSRMVAADVGRAPGHHGPSFQMDLKDSC